MYVKSKLPPPVIWQYLFEHLCPSELNLPWIRHGHISSLMRGVAWSGLIDTLRYVNNSFLPWIRHGHIRPLMRDVAWSGLIDTFMSTIHTYHELGMGISGPWWGVWLGLGWLTSAPHCPGIMGPWDREGWGPWDCPGSRGVPGGWGRGKLNRGGCPLFWMQVVEFTVVCAKSGIPET